MLERSIALNVGEDTSLLVVQSILFASFVVLGKIVSEGEFLNSNPRLEALCLFRGSRSLSLQL